LNHVERVVRVAKDAQGQRVGAPVIPLEQRPEGVAIALAGCEDQLVIVDRRMRECLSIRRS
jgi:hypothetical protein